METRPVSIWKIILIIFVFTIALTGFRALWIWYHQDPEHPEAKQGVIDLSDWEFTDRKPITLDGEWEFYPNEFLSPQHVNIDKNMQHILVPGNFNSAVTPKDNVDAYGYGTYKLTILLPENLTGFYGIRLNKVHTAAKAYINGKSVISHGQASANRHNADGRRGPVSGYFEPDSNTAELIIHVSNFGHPIEGGLIDSVQIGKDNVISKADYSSKTLQFVVALIFLLHCLYAVFLYFMGKNKSQKELLIFGALLVCQSFTILIDDDIVLQLPVTYHVFGKLTLLLFITVLLLIVFFVNKFFKRKSKVPKLIFIYYLLLLSLTIFVPLSDFAIIQFGYSIYYAWTLLYGCIVAVKELRKGNTEAIYILLFMIVYTTGILWGIAIQFGLVQFPFYPIDFLIGVFFIALILLRRQIRLAEENKEYIKKLEKEDKRKDEFLANTSHELRNPLHSIMNITHSLLENDPLSARQKDNLNLIMRVGEHMRHTLNDLLDSTKLKDNLVSLDKEAVNLNQLMAGVIDMAKFSSQGKQINWNNRIELSFPLIYADRNRLIQILFNLLNNAAKFTENGDITVSALAESGMAKISVQDTGVGIKEADLTNIFKPYEQFHDEITSYEGGTGLGLFICKQLVELHGGTISVISEECKGSVFTFTIPLYEQTHIEDKEIPDEISAHHAYSEIAAAQPKDVSADHSINILLVDDDPINLQVLKSLLENEYNLQTAPGGQEALELLNETQFDLIIADVMMPKMSGYQLTEAIRRRYSIAELPILILTARGEKEDIYTGFLAGANDYLIKPVSVLELKARVQTLTQLKQAIAEGRKLEAAWLQAQIQPHFLFNTLNTIASVGMVDSDQMITLLNEFGNYLQKSFAPYNAETFIPLHKELELIQSYLYIEKARFREKITIQWELDDNLEILIPPLSIQPILENALCHGILKRPEGGTIIIRTKESKSNYHIEIIDDGVGMSEETIDHIKNGTLKNKASGVGLGNIHRRLIKLYNKGLMIHSIIGSGTTVRIEIPAHKKRTDFE